MKVTLNRDVTTKECPWLESDLNKGQEIFTYSGYTYGCIQPYGTACSMVDGETPFFEVPTDAIKNTEDTRLEDEDMMESQTEEQPFVEVVKIKSTMDGDHPNGIEEGYVKKGIMIKRPTVGEGLLVSRVGGVFYTSSITEILEDTPDGGKFRTQNSIYKWNLIHAKEKATTE